MMQAVPSSDARGITVRGQGSASGIPDVMVASLGVGLANEQLSQVLAEGNEYVRAMLAALHAQGVAARDTHTSGHHIWWEEVRDQQGQITGERVHARWELEVKIRDTSASDRVLSAGLTAAGNHATVSNISFTHSDPVALLSKARAAAWADALHKATELAGLAGRELGAVLTVVELPAGGGAQPMSRLAMAADSAALAPGETELNVVLQVHWGWA